MTRRSVLSLLTSRSDAELVRAFDRLGVLGPLEWLVKRLDAAVRRASRH